MIAAITDDAATEVRRTGRLRDTVEQRILAPVTAAFAVIALVMSGIHLAGGQVPILVQLIPFAASILVFGLPHGALDHLMPARLDPAVGTLRSVLTVVGIYLIVGGATGLVWYLTPVFEFTAFIVITWFHWGQGDLYIDHLLRTGPTSKLDAVLTVTVRGAIPMLLPLVFFPTDYASVFRQTVHAVATPDLLTDPAVRIAIVTAVALLAAAQLTVRRLGHQPLARQGIETGVLIALFATTPPILAVGVYFTLWHAVRHIIRLELVDPVAASRLRRGELGRPFLRFLRQAWPTTVAAIALLVALSGILHRADLGSYLVFIAALTTPHTVIVTWMDRRQRVFRSGRFRGAGRHSTPAP